MAEFINKQLEHEFNRVMLDAFLILKLNGASVYLDVMEVDFPSCPYVINIEDFGYFYENIHDRDLDHKKLSRILRQNKINTTKKQEA